jgi:hypothetical protein
MSDQTGPADALLDSVFPDRARDAPRDDLPAYGFGHPAHRPDPEASYGFAPGPQRTLPLNPRRRWRLPG